MTTKRIESLKKESEIKRKSKPLSKLKLNMKDGIDKSISKIYKFYGSQIENSEDYSVKNVFDILNSSFINVSVEEVKNETIRQRISSTFLKETHRCLKLKVSTVYDDTVTTIYTILGAKVPSKSLNYRYYRINPDEPMEKYTILDFNYIAGYLTMLSKTYEYYLTRDSHFSHLNNSYEDKDIAEMINLRIHRVFSMDHRDKHSYDARKLHYRTACLMIIDAVIVLAYESNKLHLMDAYNKSQKSDYAKSYETKKNIPDKILSVMKRNEFLKDFSYMEADEDVDIPKLRAIEREYLKLRKEFNFDKLFKKKGELRFRKLGKLRALGAYYPHANCVCIDIKSPSSFMHEIAHMIDYTYEEGTNLSLKSDFTKIGIQYSQLLIEATGDESHEESTRNYVRRKLDYFTSATEMFARSFEYYLIMKGYSSSFSKKDKSSLTLEKGFPTFTKEITKDIVEYFDKLITISKVSDEEILKESVSSTLFDFKNKSGVVAPAITLKEEDIRTPYKGTQLSLF